MSRNESLLPLAFGFLTGFALIVVVLLSADVASAQEVSFKPGTFSCLPPDTQECEQAVTATKNHRRAIAASRAKLTAHDRDATLRSIQFALSNVGDGGSYVWHRANGRVSSVIRPTESFKDPSGRICRHIVVTFMSGDFTRATETVACRRASGVWEISG